MSDILDRIVAVKREEVAAAKARRSLASWREEAEGRRGDLRGFEAALRAKTAVGQSAVIAEKRRVFEQARTINIRIDPPQLLVNPDARSGRMYFRKTYAIRGKGKFNRTGEVLQELRWAKQEDGWKIVSERDLRVIRQARRQS